MKAVMNHGVLIAFLFARILRQRSALFATQSAKHQRSSEAKDEKAVEPEPRYLDQFSRELVPNLRTYYPEVEPYRTGRLSVGDGHELYYEEVGNPKGNPVLFLHGGPGGGISTANRRYFDPDVYRVILFDQRGAGKSTPHASLHNNTTWHLVSDIEKLRVHLGIEKWVVFGGSWGSTLSLAYSQTHTDRVKALILRGIFPCRRKELLWFYQEGASFLFPDEWEKYLAPIPISERSDLISAYYRRLTGDDEKVKLECARAWTGWEMATSRLYQDRDLMSRGEEDEFAIAFARIECHYFFNDAFLKPDDQLIRDATKLRNIPGVIVQGRYDVVCPPIGAWDLHKNWPTAELIFINDSGHSAKEEGILSELVKAADKFKHL